MKVKYGRQRFTFERVMTVKALLSQLGVVPEGVIVAVNGSLVTSDTQIEKDDDVEIIRAISGGAA